MAAKNGFPKCVGRGEEIVDTHKLYGVLFKNDQNCTLLNSFTVILMSGQP